MTRRHLAVFAAALSLALSIATAGTMAHGAIALHEARQAVADRAPEYRRVDRELGAIRVELAVLKARADVALGR